GDSDLVRAQGTYVDDAEIRAVAKVLRSTAKPDYNSELVTLTTRSIGGGTDQKDEMFDEAVETVLTAQRGSVSLLQRRLQIGYGRASRIIDQMAEAGLLGGYKGSQARECLITLDDWRTMRQSTAADRSGESAVDGQPTSA
ncbi:MAG: DNA translocase FtsK, partial [Phycisphaerae bacterium]|nr:DNA translocase FtsK [Phycisphaerae bacterium]